MARRMRQGEERLVQRMASSLFESYNHALACKARYDGFFDQVAKKSGGEYTPVSLKHIYRSLEKMFLQGDDPLHNPSHRFGHRSRVAGI